VGGGVGGRFLQIIVYQLLAISIAT